MEILSADNIAWIPSSDGCRVCHWSADLRSQVKKWSLSFKMGLPMLRLRYLECFIRVPERWYPGSFNIWVSNQKSSWPLTTRLLTVSLDIDGFPSNIPHICPHCIIFALHWSHEGNGLLARSGPATLQQLCLKTQERDRESSMFFFFLKRHPFILDDHFSF